MERLNDEQLAEIRKRADDTSFERAYVKGDPWKGYEVRDGGNGIAVAETSTKVDAEFIAHAREDVPKLLAEIDRLRRELSFIAHVDLVTNAYDKEHIAVSVKSWALNVLEGVNHDGATI